MISNENNPVNGRDVCRHRKHQNSELHHRRTDCRDRSQQGAYDEEEDPFRPLHQSFFALHAQPFRPRSCVAHHKGPAHGKDDRHYRPGAGFAGGLPRLKAQEILTAGKVIGEADEKNMSL
jgi:hypothetical protein